MRAAVGTSTGPGLADLPWGLKVAVEGRSGGGVSGPFRTIQGQLGGRAELEKQGIRGGLDSAGRRQRIRCLLPVDDIQCASYLNDRVEIALTADNLEAGEVVVDDRTENPQVDPEPRGPGINRRPQRQEPLDPRALWTNRTLKRRGPYGPTDLRAPSQTTAKVLPMS